MKRPQGSVTRAIDSVRSGRQEGAEVIYLRYFERLLREARTRLQGGRPGARDPEGAALSALASVLRDIERGGLTGIQDRESLLGFLVFKVREKALVQFRQEQSKKRGAGLIVGEDAVDPSDDRTFSEWLAEATPTPEDQTIWRDFFSRLEACLSPVQARVLDLDLQGHRGVDVAKLLGISPRSVFNHRKAIEVEARKLLA
jgi:DNA-directed RNA polymerase specialized sigma24 family protein